LDLLLEELTSGDDDRASAAAARIAATGEAALPVLSALLGSPDAESRWWAVRTLADMGAPPVEWLMRALADSSADVRAAAALALAAHPANEAASALVEALSDVDGVVSVLCVSALAAIGKQAVPALLEAFAGTSQRGQIEIMRTLAEIADPRSSALMLKATDEDSAMLGYWARQGLERLGLDMVYLKLE
jgi:HEAT repeat protein